MTIENRRSEERIPSVESVLFNPDTTAWDEVKEAVMDLEKICFSDGGLGEDYLKEYFLNPQNVVVLLKVNDQLVGFTCGGRDHEHDESFYVETTEIHPDWQGNKFITSMITTLEYEAKKRGYKYLTRHAAINNGYAEKIERNYTGRILETYPRSSEEFGEQQFFKIKL
jgi:GNAT superfamily N-acetyltransferase